jgi:transcription initiation factor TFIID subunit 13
MMYAHGDVLPHLQNPESVQVLNDIVSDYIIHMTRGAELHQVAARRKKINVEDFRWALRHDLPKLGRVDELLAAEQKLKAARNIFTDELAFAKDAEKGERSAETRAAKAAAKKAAGTSTKGKNKGKQAQGKTQAAKRKAKDAKTNTAGKEKRLSKKQRGKLAVKITDKAPRKVRFADSAEASVHHEATSSGIIDRPDGASDAVKALELEFDFAQALDDALATLGDDDDSDCDSDFSVLDAMNEYGDMIVEEWANEDPESEEETDSSEEDSDASDEEDDCSEEESDSSDEDDDSSEEQSDSSDEGQEGAANSQAVMAEASMSDEDDEDISEEE